MEWGTSPHTCLALNVDVFTRTPSEFRFLGYSGVEGGLVSHYCHSISTHPLHNKVMFLSLVYPGIQGICQVLVDYLNTLQTPYHWSLIPYQQRSLQRYNMFLSAITSDTCRPASRQGLIYMFQNSPNLIFSRPSIDWVYMWAYSTSIQ